MKLAAAAFCFLALTSQAIALNHNHVSTPIDGNLNYVLIFDEEFNGSLDTSKWQLNGYTDGACGHANNSPAEQTNYWPGQVSTPGDGSLHLLLTQQSNTCSAATQPFLGNLVNTATSAGNGGGNPGKFSFTHGYIEARVDFPVSGAAIANWPSFWMTGINVWPATGEIDIVEIIHGHATGCFHNGTSGNICQTNSGTASNNYDAGFLSGPHVYGLLWTSGAITWYVDGIQKGQVTTNITNDPMVIALEQSQGTLGGPTLDAAVMTVDYVHVYQIGGTPVTPQLNYAGPGDAGPKLCP